MADIHFEPWIGKDYENGGVFGKKILVLGESVYCGEQCSPCERCDLFNIGCVETYVNNNVYDENGKFRKWTNTYNKFESSLMGKNIPVEERQCVWDSIAFYNYFQTALDEARQPLGGDLEYDRAADCLAQILQQLKPQGVIVWGKRLWGCLPDKDWTNMETISNEGCNSPAGFYMIGGRKVPFMAINHPSTGYSWYLWHLNIKQFMANL